MCVSKGRAAECTLQLPRHRSRVRNVPMAEERRSEETAQPEPAVEGDPCLKVSDATLREAIEKISVSFPEFFFVHRPTLLFSPREQNSLVLNTVLALCGFFSPINSELNAEEFSSYVLDKVLSRSVLLETPRLEVVQCLLMLSIYEWGQGRNYSSWMVHGTSTKILQAFEFDNYSVDNKNAYEYEMFIRTFWSSFYVDRIICSGKNRSYTYSTKDVANVPLPSSDTDFLYMSGEDPSMPVISDITLSNFSQIPLSERSQILVYHIKVFQIWGDISKWLLSGGRRADRSKPWDPDSFVHTSRMRLEEWKRLLPNSLQWSVHAFRANLTVKTHVLFSVMHLAYNLCVIYLNREYIPFLPHSVSYPSGPFEPPLLPEPPEKDFWVRRSSELFGAAKTMALIAHQLEDADSQMTHPYLSNCYFFCATVCIYAWKFPWMNPENNREEHEKFSRELISFLKRREGKLPLSQKWLIVLDEIQELYDFVTDDLERARRLNLGREFFTKLENSVQAVNSDIPPPIRDAPQLGAFIRKEESLEEFPYRRAPESSDIFLVGADESAHDFLTMFLQTLNNS